MATIWQDVRYALRTLTKSQGFTLVAVLTLAIGIGANTAIFTLVESVLLRPLPYPQPEQLVRIHDAQPPHDLTPADYAEYLDWREQKQVFTEVAAYFQSSFDLTGQGEPIRVTVIRASANFLPMLGITPLTGREFRPEDETRASERVCLISEGLWQRQFGRDPAIVGKSLNLSDFPFLVIGILPRQATIPSNPDIVAGLRLDAAVSPRGFHFINVVGRLRAGLSLEQARKEVEPFAAVLRKERSIDHGIALASLKDETTRGSGTPLLVLLGAVGFVLLIACSNVANLLLARAQGRRREVAIRIAMGATRWRILRQLLTESAVLAFAGGALGLFTANWLTSSLFSTNLVHIPRSREIHMDVAVYAFTALLAFSTTVFFGLSPALLTLRSTSAEVLKESARGTSPRSGRYRSFLIVSEIALSFVLLIGAGLLLRSFDALLKVNKGFDPQRVLTFDLILPQTRYQKPEQQVAFYQQLSRRLKSVPGVDSFGMINQLALARGNTNGDVAIEGKTFAKGSEPIADKRIAGADYFRALRIPLLRGRYFNDHDVPGALAVAIINESFARKYLPGEDPIGKHVDFQWDTAKGWQEIVGVVGDVKHDGLNLPSNAEIYVPYAQRPDPYFTVAVRTHSDPLAMRGAIREQILQTDAGLPMANVRTMAQVVSTSVADQRLTLLLLGSFAVLALVLTVVGLYGVIAYNVSLRTQEIGIRMALGARRSDVFRMVVGEGVRLAALGASAGLLAALGLTRFMSSLLFNVRPTDALTYTVISVALVMVTSAASYMPARRATRIDPLVALRYE
jgi:putative ABC transport system permease protein